MNQHTILFNFYTVWKNGAGSIERVNNVMLGKSNNPYPENIMTKFKDDMKSQYPHYIGRREACWWGEFKCTMY